MTDGNTKLLNSIEQLKLDPEFKKRWVKALRSGDIAQIKGTLVQTDDNGVVLGMCCLGVGAYVAGVTVQYMKEHNTPTFSMVQSWYPSDANITLNGALPNNPLVTVNGWRMCLTACNDTAGMSFAEIADIIEEQL